jgi:hypothetical protein
MIIEKTCPKLPIESLDNVQLYKDTKEHYSLPVVTSKSSLAPGLNTYDLNKVSLMLTEE